MKDLFIYRKDYRLSYRLLLSILICSSFFTIIGTAVQLYVDYNKDIERIHNSISHIKKGYLQPIAGSLWAMDVIQLKRNLEGAANFPDMQYLEVREKRKKSEVTVEAIGIRKDADIISKSYPLFYGKDNRQIGTLLVVASKEGVFKRLQDKVLLILATQALKTFFVSIGILFIFYFLVMKHLNHLSKYFRDFSLKKLDTPLSLHRKSEPSHPDEFGRLVGSVNLMRMGLKENIEERALAAEALRESEAFLKTLIDAIPTPVFYKDKDGRYLGFNRAFERFFGETRERLIGKSVFDINPPELAEIYNAQDDKLFHSGGTQRYESQWKNVHGELRDFIFHKAAFADIKGRVTGLIGVLVDITERKRNEEERKGLEDQLHQSQKIEAIGTLAGGIAHDFNNILGIILGNAELAMDDVPEWNPARQNLDEVRKACLRAKDVVSQILSFSRKAKVEQRLINLAPVVTESLKLLRASIPTSIDIRQNISNDTDDILGDTTQIHQIMINLCTNAAHAMENEGGILEITIENITIDEDTASRYPQLHPGPYVHLSVSDTGDGMETEVVDRIFDPYFTTKGVGKGTGLGLSVVHGIVNSHNGRISVESSAGKGTTFKILFPAVEKQIPEKPKKLEELPTGQERILFVDDENAMVSLNQQRLERLGYKVTGKTDPSEALEFFRSDPNQFDLVITDMTMPRMTGDKLAQEVLKIRSDIPIIICTGYSNRMSEAKAQELGIRKYIEKPIEMENLARLVREVLDGK